MYANYGQETTGPEKIRFKINPYDSYREFLQNRRKTCENTTNSTTTTNNNNRNNINGDGNSTSGVGSGSETSSSSVSTYSNSSNGDETAINNDDILNAKCEENPLTPKPISIDERVQIESFFKGLQTQVYVCGTLANLYLKMPHDHDWQLKYTGVPVIVLDAGHCRARTKRRIQIVLAERGTGFMLWHDTIDNLSAYRVSGKAFHTMCYSTDHSIQIGLSFDTVLGAQELWTHMERLISCPENICLSSPGKKKKNRKKSQKTVPMAKIPSKSHISQPCCFQHIISVDQDDTGRFYSLKELVIPAEKTL